MTSTYKMATSFTEKLSEEIFNYSCSRCCKKNKAVKSEKFCLECQQHLCSTCLELHNNFHDEHNLQDPTHSSQSQLPTERCSKHPTKVLEMFCRDHDEVGCSTCVSTEHRSCASVVDISSTIQQLFDSNTLGQVKIDLQKLSSKFKGTTSLGNEHVNRLDRAKDEHLSAIDDYVETLVAMIQKLGEEARQSLLETYKTEEDRLQNNQMECESAEKETELLLRQIENQDKNKAQVFVIMKKGLKMIHQGNILLQKHAEKRRDLLSKFNKNSEIEQYLSNIQTLGTVCNQPLLYKWKKKDMESIKIKSDSMKCSIHGSCLLSDGSLLLSDCFNQKLKRLDPTTLTITAHCDLPAEPYGVCSISHQEAAVCLKKKTIQFVSLGDMTLTRSIQLNHVCYDIGFHNNKLYLSNHGNGILLYNMDGSLLQFVDLGLSRTRHVVFSKSGVCIADWDKGLVCIDISMKEQFRYKGQGLSGCGGVCTDLTGSVFVCGYNSHNVVQVTETGQPLGEVVSQADGVKYPLSMIWDSGKSRLYVAGWSDTVTIFEA